MVIAKPHCFRLLTQVSRLALAFAEFRAGKSSPARIAMMAITTSNSIKVNPKPAARGQHRVSFFRSRIIKLSTDRFWYDTGLHGQPRENSAENDSRIQGIACYD